MRWNPHPSTIYVPVATIKTERRRIPRGMDIALLRAPMSADVLVGDGTLSVRMHE